VVFDIVFSERALGELTSILEYLESEWSFRISNEFTKILDEKINNIRSNPYLYPPFKNKIQLRRCVVTKQVSMFYSINNSEIQIITLFDNRKNPKKLKL